MQRFLIILVIFLSGKTVFSQQQYYIYIESANKQAFYVLLAGKTYSSSESGYVILPKLDDNTQQFAIGFPKKIFPEQQFSIGVNKKDAGYQLKNLDEKGWALFNLQTASLTMSSSPSPEKKNADVSGVKKTDEFSVLLANVVNDSSILYTAVAVQATPPPAVKTETKPVPVIVKKADEPKPIDSTKDSAKHTVAALPPPAVSTNTTSNNVPVVTNNSVPVPPPVIIPATIPTARPDSAGKLKEQSVDKKATIAVTKLKESLTDNALNITYEVAEGKGFDTVLISVPFEKPAEKKPDTIAQPTVSNNDSILKKQPEKKEVAVTTAPVVVTTTESANKKSNVPASPPPINDCKNYAADADVDKLRVKMLASKSRDEKLDAAKKIFKTKCFSVRQIKALSELFKTDEDRYLFFTTAYKSVSDTYNYPELINLLSEERYVNSFKEMLR